MHRDPLCSGLAFSPAPRALANLPPKHPHTQTPVEFVFKHFKAAAFTVGKCKFTKTFSKGSEKVLYR